MGIWCIFHEHSEEEIDYYSKHRQWKEPPTTNLSDFSAQYVKSLRIHDIGKMHEIFDCIFSNAQSYLGSSAADFIYRGIPLPAPADKNIDKNADEENDNYENSGYSYYNVKRTKEISEYLQEFVDKKIINKVNIVQIYQKVYSYYQTQVFDPVIDAEAIDEQRFQLGHDIEELQRFFCRVAKHRNCVFKVMR
ncbi:MAG: YfbM family protein [Planctomycetaceae bacterium]|jgi:hypothetical protein|nr:YfbM family protein [Planctomycetaceae bacterium]